MANTILTDSSTKAVWESNFAKEYVRESGFLAYMGTADNSIVRVKNNLMNAGAIVHVPMIAKLSGNGVTGSSTLKGSEEALANYSYAVRTSLRRNGVTVNRDQSFKTEIDLLDAAKSSLRDWAARQLRTDFINQLQSVVVKAAANGDGTPGEDSNVLIGVATEAQKDAFLDNNYDRILFGATKSNISTSAPAGGATRDHSASLLNVDSAADKLSAGILGVAKRMAKQTGTVAGKMAIQPYKSDATAGREFYVLFVDSNGFRDLAADTLISQANRDARPRDVEQNPLFQDGDLLYQGVVIKEIPEMSVLAGQGAAGIDVGTAFLCGANALTLAWSQKPTARTQIDDYELMHGVAIEEIRGVGKTAFNGSQIGCVTVYHASVGDA